MVVEDAMANISPARGVVVVADVVLVVVLVAVFLDVYFLQYISVRIRFMLEIIE